MKGEVRLQDGGDLIADLNDDDWLDIAVTTRKLHCVRIFWNGQDGFDPKRERRLKVSGPLGVDAADFNSDGWLDIFVAIDASQNELWINQQDGSFVNVAREAGLDNQMNDMGVALGDYDNDGDLDIYVTNVTFGKCSPLAII